MSTAAAEPGRVRNAPGLRPGSFHEEAIRATLVARSYLRVSEDRAKQKRSTSEQDTENTRAISAQGWVQGEPYRDDGISASRYSDKIRDEFQRLIEDLRSRDFGADVLVLWETSRGSREMWEWVMLIDLLAKPGCWSTSPPTDGPTILVTGATAAASWRTASTTRPRVRR